MSIPVWNTPPGSLGTIPEGIFYSIPLSATADSTVYYQLISGNLPPGMFIDETGILSGNPAARSTAEGIPLPVAKDTTSRFAVRAFTKTNQLADRTFSITVTGQNTVTWTTPAGLIGTYYDGNQIAGLQVTYFDADIYATPTVSLISGSLPPGLAISSSGLISGYILPNIAPGGTPGYSYNGVQGYSNYPYDFTTESTTTTYQFTLKVSNGQSSDTRTFSIIVYALDTMTADNTQLTADNTYVTADVSPLAPPIITTPTGSIGSVRGNNFFAFQFSAVDFNYNQVQFVAETSLPPGLTLDPNSGWLYGYISIPAGSIISTVYSFSIYAREIVNPTNVSQLYSYNLTVTGPIGSDVTWLTPSNLGSIFNGSTSTFYVSAVNSDNLPLTYQLLSGSNSRLPQGLQLMPSGNIVGRVSFDTFACDGGATTFDATTNSNTTIVPVPTTFDMVCTFTVQATSSNGLVNSSQQFSIRVVREYNQPYDNLYIQAMPPEADRALLASLLQSNLIFPPNLIYRFDDPNFGVANNVIYEHAYGLTAATLESYVASLSLNHYWKNLVLGEIKTAQAIDPTTGNVLYEVVYSEVVDTLVNNAGESVGKSVDLPYTVETDVAVVYPNSLVDMRQQVIDQIGQVSNVLPLWMLSKQSNGQTLGFTPAWVIAYTNPGQSGQIAYNIQTYFGNQLNLVDFEADRYELGGLLTKNWNPYTDTIALTSISGNGTTITATYPTQLSVPYVLGQQITIAGVTPTDYNGTYFVTACSTTSVSFLGRSTATATGGTISTVPGWQPSPPQDATFDIDSHYQVTSFTGGNGYRVGDTVTISGTAVGGVSPLNDITITVNQVSITNPVTNTGVIVGYFVTAQAPINSAGTTYTNITQTTSSGTGTGSVWNFVSVPGTATTFDYNSLQFIAPVDMYSTTNAYDRYLLFPKYNILTNVPSGNNETVRAWFNNYGDFVNWVNNTGDPVNWVSINS